MSLAGLSFGARFFGIPGAAAARAATRTARTTRAARTTLRRERGALGALGNRAGRRRTRDAIDRTRASQKSGRRALDAAETEIAAGVKAFDNFSADGMTIGNQLTRMASIGLGATAINKGISSYQDSFGDKHSGFVNFMMGLTKFGVTATAGVAGITAFGRATILASGKYGSMGKGAAAVDRLRNSIKSTAMGADDMAVVGNAADAMKRLGRVRASGTNVAVGRHRQAADALPVRRGTLSSRIRRHDVVTSRARRISRKAHRGMVSQNAINRNASKLEASLTKNQAKIKMSHSMESAKNFGAAKSILAPVGLFPVKAMGAMVGRGSVWGKVDPTMTYVGGAMAAGTLSGLGVGTAVGIGSIKRGNLKRTVEARSRPQERSFSNINYNATLHAHRMSM